MPEHDLFADLRGAFPRWHMWRSTVGLLYARRVNTSPARIVRAEDAEGLASQMEAHESVIWGVSEKSGQASSAVALKTAATPAYKLRDGGHSWWYDRP